MFNEKSLWRSIKKPLRNISKRVLYMNLAELHKVISRNFKRVQKDPKELSHLLTLDEQYPEIDFIICDNSVNPYQMFDQYFFRNNFRINKHNIIIPRSVLEKIYSTGFHAGESAIEYRDYRKVSPLKMSKSEFVTAIAVHELSHVFQLYIQDYISDDDHTEEFYDVLESFYDSEFIDRMNHDLRFLDK